MNDSPNQFTQNKRRSVSQAHTVAWDTRHRQGVLELMSGVPFKAELWEWEFEMNPFQKDFSPVLILGDDDAVLGFNGVLPIEATERGKPIDALWSCDFHVSPAWRGLGLGSRIKAELHRKASIIMAFGISDQATQVLKHLGWRPESSVQNYRLLRQQRGWRDCAFRALQCVNRLLGLFQPTRSSPFIRVSSQLPDATCVNSLWQREAPGFPRVVTRNYAYLDWKYQRHPLARYAFVQAWDDDRLLALLVVRYHRGTLRIIDYSGPASNPRLKRALIRFSRHHWRHARQISTITSDREFGRCLRAEGFFRPRTRPRFYVFEDSGAELSSVCGWFIMAGDSDGELLLAAADFSGEGVGAENS